MKHTFFLLAAFVLGCTTTTATTDAYTLSATASLRDGSTLKGTLLTETVKGAAIFNDSLELSLTDVKSLAFAGTNGEAKTTLINGDILSLTVATPAFELDSSLGKLTLTRGNLSKLTISAHRIVKPTGLSDGDY